MPYKIVKYQLTSGQQSAGSFQSFFGVGRVVFVTMTNSRLAPIQIYYTKSGRWPANSFKRQLDDNCVDSVSRLLNKDPGVHLGWASVKRRVQWTISTLSFCSRVVERTDA